MARPTHSGDTARDLEYAEREARIIELRKSRVSFRDIGNELGISHARAYQIYKNVLDRIPATQLAALRLESNELIERGITNLLEIAESTSVSPRTRVEAWNGVLKFCESQRKLYGVDAPQRKEIAVLTEDTVDKALRKLSEEFDAKARELDELENRAVSGLRDLGEDVVR